LIKSQFYLFVDTITINTIQVLQVFKVLMIFSDEDIKIPVEGSQYCPKG